MGFNLSDFGNSSPNTRNKPVVFANQSCPGFTPSLDGDRTELSAQEPVWCFLAAGCHQRLT